MTDPDPRALSEARSWVEYTMSRTDPWTHEEEIAALAERFAKARAEARADAIEEAVKGCGAEAITCPRGDDAMGWDDRTSRDVTYACTARIRALAGREKR